MTDQERERAINFIVETLGRLVINDQKQDTRIEKLIDAHEKAITRLGRDERILGLMIRAGRRERTIRREQEKRYDRRYQELLTSQAHTDSRLDALIDIVRQRMNGRNKA